MSIEQSAAKSVKNLHTTGVGFINRLRRVPVRKGNPYFCVAIGAQYGLADEKGHFESSLYDLRVVTNQAIKDVELLEEYSKAGKTIFVEFKAGDTRAEPFTYKSGDRAGTMGASIKGTLLQIRGAWIDGERVIDHSSSGAVVADYSDSGLVDSESNNDHSSEAEAAVDQSTSAAIDESQASADDSELNWRQRLEQRPERITVLKNDHEAMDKILAIGSSGCYDQVDSEEDDRVLFQLKAA